MTWRQLRLEVFERENYLRQTCFKKTKDVHHLLPRRKIPLDLRDNLVSLCHECHKLRELFPARYMINVPMINRKFIANMSKMRKKLVIYIPTKYHQEMKKSFKGKPLLITCMDAIPKRQEKLQ